MTLLITLASGAVGEKTWWNPYLKGAIITVLAMALFVGSAYLLLYTNVGSRLGFLLTAAATTGFIAVLAVFWITAQFVTGPKGSIPGWPVEEVVPDLSESQFEPVRNIRQSGEEAPGTEAGQIRAELDTQLTDPESPNKLYSAASEFITVETLTTGGGRKWPWFWSEKTTYGAALICTASEPEVLPLEPPPTPECDESIPAQWVVVVKDLGSQRLPQFYFLGASAILFALSLLALDRYEKEHERPKAGPEGNGAGAGGDGDTPGGNGSAPDGEPAEPAPANA